MTDPSPASCRRTPRALLLWTVWAWSLAALGAACGAPLPAGEQTVAATARKPAAVMSHQGAAWLEREGRDKEERPEVVLEAMELKEGMTVAEIGTGTGYFARRIAKVVGPTGKVLAVDIQPEMLVLLEKYAAEGGIKNIVPILGTETDPKLPKAGVDRILMVDVYHEFQKPEEMLARIRESLAPGGRVILVEYRAEGETASHINKEHRMTTEQVLSEWNQAGFELINQLETLPSQHLFLFTSRRGARAMP
jgi:ubiquinone/menaquinone biosynthesis C-methylase UbiE